MKKIDLHGITQMQSIGGTDSWYFATDYTSGDLYEAEELYRNGHEVKNNHLYLLHFPDGEVFEPIHPEVHCYFGTPIFYENAIYILCVDFGKQKISIHRFESSQGTVTEVRCIPLNQVEDCYNLMFHKSPLMLTRQSAENRFEIIRPEQVEFGIHPRESFVFREEDKLYFSMRHKDPEYREESVVRSLMGDHMKIIRTFSYLEKRSDYLFYSSIQILIARNENSRYHGLLAWVSAFLCNRLLLDNIAVL